MSPWHTWSTSWAKNKDLRPPIWKGRSIPLRLHGSHRAIMKLVLLWVDATHHWKRQSIALSYVEPYHETRDWTKQHWDVFTYLHLLPSITEASLPTSLSRSSSRKHPQQSFYLSYSTWYYYRSRTLSTPFHQIFNRNQIDTNILTRLHIISSSFPTWRTFSREKHCKSTSYLNPFKQRLLTAKLTALTRLGRIQEYHSDCEGKAFTVPRKVLRQSLVLQTEAKDDTHTPNSIKRHNKTKQRLTKVTTKMRISIRKASWSYSKAANFL